MKAKLSEYVQLVAEGETVTVTDRGRPVARLVGLQTESLVQKGIDEGWISEPRRRKLATFEPRPSKELVLDVLDEDRG